MDMQPTLIIALVSGGSAVLAGLGAQVVAGLLAGRRDRERLGFEREQWAVQRQMAAASLVFSSKQECYANYIAAYYAVLNARWDDRVLSTDETGVTLLDSLTTLQVAAAALELFDADIGRTAKSILDSLSRVTIQDDETFKAFVERQNITFDQLVSLMRENLVQREL